MAQDSKIEWTDHTFNPWEGCQKVSPGCDHCYAETRNARFGGGQAVNWGPGAPRRRTSASNWNKPKVWDAAHAEFFAQHGRRQRVFCASLADVFDNAVDPTWRADLFTLIEATPNLDWLLLTKRIGNAADMMFLARGGHLPLLPNVWIGATIVNQEEADRDIPKLLSVPASVRFLSMEPLLGPVDLTDLVQKVGPGEHHFSALECDVETEDDQWGGATIDWVIVGGESGPGARPMSIPWARELRDQCVSAGVPFFFKQWGEWAPSRRYQSEVPGTFAFGDYKDDRERFVRTGHYPRAFTSFGARCILEQVGKKAAGRLLDGRTWDEVPA
ncbi:phage Gp37/Gp68 family protein [Ottowia sp. VDI28]|uniref:phage Gp37/Gp68 family protein n=1 Tax=Ottowia sp. VDI28 TaxID=3133968 RepID=UPI003C2DB8B3